MKTLTKTVVASTLALGLAGAAAAQQMQGGEHMDHAGHHPVPATTAQTDTPATKAFRDVDAEMHRNMDIRYSNDVDVDFVRGMIPQLAASSAMAMSCGGGGKDKEISEMEAWLKQHGK